MIGENTMSPADVAAVIGNSRGYGGYGGYGDGFGFGGSWFIVFLALMMFGGWGGGYGMNGMGGGMFPWLMAGQQGINTNVNNGFDNAAVMGQLGGIQNAITDGFGRQEIAACGRAMDAMQTAYGNQIAELNRSFSAQTAVDSRLDSLAMALQQCCCDNRLATENLRATSVQNTRDIIDNSTRNTQFILDKLCQLELDGVKQNYENRIAGIQNALEQERANNQSLRFAASQTAQNALISQGFANEVDALYNRLNSCPVPTTPVYGRTPIFTCQNNNGGCGCGNGFVN